LAQKRGVIRGRKMRVDTTVVESNIHYPTDSGLLNDGARVLTRTMKKIEQKTGGLKRKVRNRMRSVSKRVIAIGQALRHKGTEGELERKAEYRQLLRLTRQILNDSRRVLQEVETLPSGRRRGMSGLGERLQTMAEQVRAVVRQTKARVFAGLTQFPGKTAESVVQRPYRHFGERQGVNRIHRQLCPLSLGRRSCHPILHSLTSQSQTQNPNA